MSKFKNFLNVLRTERLAAREDLLSFIECMKEDYKAEWFHEVVCDGLTEFGDQDEAVYKMLFMPPQNGKSEISSRHFPAYLLGKNPKLKIAVISYNATVASGFGDDITRIMNKPQYKSVFPDTIVGEKGLKNNKYIMETTEGGYVVNVGVGGSLTSKTVDVFIFDDLYKGPMDAWSPLYRERVWNFYNAVAETRGHKKEKMLILYTRWHEDDLAGRLLESNPGKWGIDLFQGVKTKEFDHIRDPRKPGEILWPSRHSLEKYLELKERDIITFEALFQQNPKPVKGLMYPNHLTWDTLEGVRGIKKAYIDTADSGGDYLSAIFYIESGPYSYITDIYYTKDDMDTTYKEVARRLGINGTTHCEIESNNGGRFFGKQVQKETKGNCSFKLTHQSENKEARIFAASAAVQNYILFPHDWRNKHPEAYNSFTKYRREGKNANDDFQDAITGVIEKNLKLNNKMAKVLKNPLF